MYAASGYTALEQPVDAELRKNPSVGYLLSFTGAALGIMALTIAVDSARRAAAGGDPLDAMSTSAVGALLFVWALLYYVRLAFWSRVSSSRQAVVTLSLRILLVVEVVAAVAGSVYVFTSPAASGGTQAFMAFADLLQVGTVLWIVRYSRE